MKIYRKLTINLKSNRVIEEDSYDYDGPVALCFGGGGTEVVEKSPIPREFSGLATQLGQFLGGTPRTLGHYESKVVGYQGESNEPVYADVWVPGEPGEPGKALAPTPYAGTYSDMYQNLLRAQQQIQRPTAAEQAIQTGVQTGYMYPYAGQLDPYAQMSQTQMAATGAPYNLTAAFMGSYPAYQAALDAALAQAKESASMQGGLRGSAGAQYMGQAAAGTTADFLKYLTGVGQQSYEAAQARRQAAIQQAAQQAAQQQAAWESATARQQQYIPMAYEAATWPAQAQAQQLAQAMQLGQGLETTGTYPWLSFIQSLIGTPQAQYIATPQAPSVAQQLAPYAGAAATAYGGYQMSQLIAALAAMAAA
jgi:hypothetical protein